MLNIVENYKLLYKSFLGNNLVGNGAETQASQESAETLDINNSGDNVDEIIKEIIKDKKIDGGDFKLVEELSKKFNGETKEELNKSDRERRKLYKETKYMVSQAIDKMLDDGYTVESEQSYIAISKLLADTKGFIMPQYNEIIIEDIKNFENKKFTISLDGKKFFVYKPVHDVEYDTITGRVGIIDVKEGTFAEIEPSFWDTDHMPNNNKIDLNIDDIEFKVFRDSYQQLKVLDKPELMNGDKPKKRVKDVYMILFSPKDSLHKISSSKTNIYADMRDNMEEILTWNKKVEYFNKNGEEKQQKIENKNIEELDTVFNESNKEKDNNSIDNYTSNIDKTLGKTKQESKVRDMSQVETTKEIITKKFKKEINGNNKKYSSDKIKNKLNNSIESKAIDKAIIDIEKGITDNKVISILESVGGKKMNIILQKNHEGVDLNEEGQFIEKKSGYSIKLDSTDIEMPLMALNGKPTKAEVLYTINRINKKYMESKKQYKYDKKQEEDYDVFRDNLI